MAGLKSAAARPTPQARTAPRRWAGLVIFALLVTVAPLAFGAVDRFSQIVLLGLLALGILLHPPIVTRLGKWANVLVLTILGTLLLKEFAPASWFGEVPWRTTLLRNYAIDFPWTHNPEPGRALDALLSIVVAAIWFVWVRTLAAERADRPIIAWTLFAAAAIVAAVSFATRQVDTEAIYGLRYTAGWKGFGPFPNRNHTASFLAMGAVLGMGCVTWAGMRKHYAGVVVGLSGIGLLLAALLTTQSRGGLIAFGCGTGLFILLVLMKLRDRRAAAFAAAALLLLVALALIFGADLLGRFNSAEGGQVSNVTRINVWRDTVSMWKDAPLFGHGLNSFTQLIPLYLTFELANQVVLHPESSWLQWLTELGAVPLLLGVIGFVAFLAGHLRMAFQSRTGFFLRAAGFAAIAVLLCHAFIDVPAHRWGTAAFALAALALACPPRDHVAIAHATRRPALVAFAIALFWAMPLLADVPTWSPLSLARLLLRETTTASVNLPQLEQALGAFPLSPPLHQAIGMHQLFYNGRSSADWARHFQIAARLTPGTWATTYEQARACRRVAPGHSLYYWQLTVERGARHREDLFMLALQETAAIQGAATIWASYAETHPELLLLYLQSAPEDERRGIFERWWQGRGLSNEALTENEVRLFYAFVPRFGAPAHLEQWMQRRSRLRAADYKTWAGLFHEWRDDARAWELIKASVPDPSYPTGAPNFSREQLELRLRTEPDDFVTARALAQVLMRSGDNESSSKIVLAIATRPDAPPWFVNKAAHLLAESGRVGEAVEIVLKPRAGP